MSGPEEQSMQLSNPNPLWACAHLPRLCELAALERSLSGPYRDETSALRLLAALFHCSPSPLTVTDAMAPDQPILYANQVFLSATGYTADEVRLTCHPLTFRWVTAEFERHLQAECLRSGYRYRYEHKLSHRSSNVAALAATPGSEPCIAAERSGCGAQVVGKNCRFLQAAPGARREPTPASTAIRTAMVQGRARGTRLLNFRKDGSPLWNDLTIVPLRNAEGVITHHIGMQSFSAVGEVSSGGRPSCTPPSLPLAARGGLLSASFAKSRSCVNLTS